MWQVAPAGDQALLVTVGRTIDPSLLGQVLALDRVLAGRPPSGLISTVPAYASLLCHYDPGVTDAARLEASILQLEGHVDAAMALGSVVEVPTRYDGSDLASVALATNLTPAAVIEMHAGREYLVYCVGFAPGFTYCGALPDPLSLPRLGAPRLRVSPGCIGDAGRQSGTHHVARHGRWGLRGSTR